MWKKIMKVVLVGSLAIVALTGATLFWLVSVAVEAGHEAGWQTRIERWEREEVEEKQYPPQKPSPMWESPREWSRAHCKGPSRSKMCV
jgi:hypothetical protein